MELSLTHLDSISTNNRSLDRFGAVLSPLAHLRQWNLVRANIPQRKVVILTMAKEKAVILKQTKSTKLLRVPAYSDDKLVGYGEVTVFKANDAGLEAARLSLTLSDLENLNRQRVTDVKNNVRRGRSIWAALKEAAKTNPGLAKDVEVLAKKYGFELRKAA